MMGKLAWQGNTLHGREICTAGKFARQGNLHGREICTAGKFARQGNLHGREICTAGVETLHATSLQGKNHHPGIMKSKHK